MIWGVPFLLETPRYDWKNLQFIGYTPRICPTKPLAERPFWWIQTSTKKKRPVRNLGRRNEADGAYRLDKALSVALELRNFKKWREGLFFPVCRSTVG